MATTSNINRTLFCQFFTLPSSLHLCRQFLMLLILLYLPAGLCLNHCMLQQIYKNVIPYGGQSAGTFTPRDIDRHKFNSLDSLMEECGNICCQDDACDVVYVYNMKCYTLDCVNADMCEPIESLEGKETYMAFIARAMSSHLDGISYIEPRNIATDTECKPYKNDCPVYEECLLTIRHGNKIYLCQCIDGYQRDSDSGSCLDMQDYTMGKDYDYSSFSFNNDNSKQLISNKYNNKMHATSSKDKYNSNREQIAFCDRITRCPKYEYCQKVLFENGICKCINGLQRNGRSGACEPIQSELPGSTVGLTTSNTAQITLPNDETSDKVNGGDDTDELETLLNILGEEKTPQQTPNPAPSSQVTQPPIATDALNSVIPLPDKKNNKLIKEGDTVEEVGDVITDATNMDEVPSNSTESEIVIGAVPTETTVIPVHTTKTVTEPVTTLTVSAGEDRILQLPEEDSVSLIAYVIPEPSNTTHYKYEWSVVSKPQGSTGGEIEYKHSKKVNLLKLTAGKYVFKVSVSGDHSYGETRVNVTVNPPLRINTPPVAVIFPKTQDVTLPNNQAVLDGSKSHDDDKIVSYHWEEIKGPLSGEKILGDEALLTMTDLIPGTYILKLTVVDSDGAIDATTANVSVTEATDYPPVANAGTTQAIKLPTDSVVLNGSLSTDDKGIVAYEWSKSSGGVADMQGSSKSILHLSGLEQGVYTFTLKVTDSAGQSSTASVMVIVQPENNFPPVADAGPDKEISLPNDDTTLDGSKSHDDNGITSYKWKKISGPGDVIIKDSDTIVATVSNLVEGTYVFELTVTDGEGSTNSDQVTVIVKQEIDQPPVADAGEDMVIELPQKYVAIDGSKSHDDFSITSYQWLRDPKSPAAGEIMRDSNHEAILRLTNLVVGMYKFSLRVTDAKGQHATDYMTLEVKEDPHMIDLIEVHIDTDIFVFTQENKDTLVRQLSVLLGVMDPDIVVQSVRESPLGGVVIQFYILNADGKRVLKGITMVNKLKSKLSKESQVLDYNVMLVDTVVCQNDCSGHGHCNVETKQCICESFWMENYFKIYLGDGESNCEWSILYVVIIGSLVVVTIGGIIWAIYCCIKRRRMMRGRKRHRYTLLDEYDGREAVEMLPKSSNGKQNSSIMISETDSEEETLYEGKKTNGYKPRSKPLNGIIGRQHKRKDKKSLKPLLQPQKKTEDIDDFL